VLKEIQLLLKRSKAPPVDIAAHVAGIRMGNQPGSYDKQPGHLPDGRATAERSTGINADKRNPIDARMPNLPPP
jgi:hypothetical protein